MVRLLQMAEGWAATWKWAYILSLSLSQKMLKFQASERVTAVDALHEDYFNQENSEGYQSPDSSDNSSLLNTSASSDSGIHDS